MIPVWRKPVSRQVLCVWTIAAAIALEPAARVVDARPDTKSRQSERFGLTLGWKKDGASPARKNPEPSAAKPVAGAKPRVLVASAQGTGVAPTPARETAAAPAGALATTEAAPTVAAPAPTEAKASPVPGPAPAAPKGEAKASAAPAASPSALAAKPEAKVSPAAVAPVVVNKAKPAPKGFARWVDVQTATASARYRRIQNDKHVTTGNALQDKAELKGRIKFDAKGNYSVNVGVSSGSNFTGSWNNTGVGTGDLYTNLFVKQIFAEAKPIKGLELQFGGLYVNRGESTEITTYDNDAYIVGERLSIKRRDRFFVDEFTATYGYVGDLSQPNVFKRLHRLNESNYHQFLVARKLGKRIGLSADYTSQSGVETVRGAFKINVAGSHVLDTLQLETYRRLGSKSAAGFAIYADRKLTKKLTIGSGYADIDPNHANLNSDRFFKGKRVYFSSSYVLSPLFTISAWYQQAVNNTIAMANYNRLDLIVQYNVLKGIQDAFARKPVVRGTN